MFTYDIGDTTSYNPVNNLITMEPNITIDDNLTTVVPVNVTAIAAGHVVLGVNSSSHELTNLSDTFMRIDVVHSHAVKIVNAVIGWMYFAAWSISFYPQLILNFRRKSVVGLNFDFLVLNVLGFACYTIFNVGLYWVDVIQSEYTDDHPRGVIPVEINDCVFAIHALFITIVTVLQVACYERGGQKVSRVCIILVIISLVFLAISLGLSLGHVIKWLLYMYFFSYVKLGVTLIKYVPQAYMNFRRKSTIGWSIGNVLLDFTGGSLSMLQMFLLAYNNNDWSSIFGNPTKFGLGLFSVLFDIVFITQHYVLYRGRDPYEPIVNQEVDVKSMEGKA